MLTKTVNYHIDDEDEVGLDEVLQVGESPDVDAPPGMIATTVSLGGIYFGKQNSVLLMVNIEKG